MPDLTPNGPAVRYEVTSQQETTELDDKGRAGPGVRIGFTTAGGLHGSVFVRRDRYNPENVRAAIRDWAGRMEQVHKLKD